MNPLYAPKTPEGRLFRLGEEIGEVMIEAGAVLRLLGKAGRFGLDSHHPKNGDGSNADAILRSFSALRSELDDLQEAIQLVESDLLDRQIGVSG